MGEDANAGDPAIGRILEESLGAGFNGPQLVERQLMHAFLSNNRDELIERCKAKVAQRPRRAATEEQLSNGVPMFLAQLIRTLVAEEAGADIESLRISGPSGGDSIALSEMGVTAAAHGKALLRLGYSVDQVVHDYGDLCQAITDLAFERDAPFTIDEFRTLNRCLDNAIADAVTEFSTKRDVTVASEQTDELNERLGALTHDLRYWLHVSTVAFTALESGTLPIGGSTGRVLKRSLVTLGKLVDQSVADIRMAVGVSSQTELFSLAEFIAQARDVAALEASASECLFRAAAVDPHVGLQGNRELLMAALSNLLQNAFKFTHAHTEVSLNAYAAGNSILIDVCDHCGGLPTGSAERMFRPFAQSSGDHTGLGLGLTIARDNVEADGGMLSVQDVPGHGCVFTMSLPRELLQQ